MDFERLKDAMGDLEEEEMVAILEEVMAAGGADAPRAMEACQAGMDILGARFEEGEYFVGDLIYAGELMTQAVEIMGDALSGTSDGSKAGRMILCTVKDDLHDICKNIVRAMLTAAGFEVLDLGIDCPAERVVEEAKKNDIRIIALSGVLTLALESMKQTVAAFEAAGLRDQVKIIVGGNPVSESACAMIGADEWAYSPQKTINVCKAWAEALK